MISLVINGVAGASVREMERNLKELTAADAPVSETACEKEISTLKAELVDCHSTREAARVTVFFEHVEGPY